VRYVLSPQADADLVSIYEYTITTWGVDQFHLYRQQIESAIQAIVANPLLPRSKERNDLLTGIRLFRVEHHYIAYRVRTDVVEIGRVLHESMHFETQVSDDDFQFK